MVVSAPPIPTEGRDKSSWTYSRSSFELLHFVFWQKENYIWGQGISFRRKNTHTHAVIRKSGQPSWSHHIPNTPNKPFDGWRTSQRVGTEFNVKLASDINENTKASPTRNLLLRSRVWPFSALMVVRVRFHWAIGQKINFNEEKESTHISPKLCWVPSQDPLLPRSENWLKWG